MTQVGDKQILTTQTLLLGDDESQARNSFARIVILGMSLLALFVLIGIAMFARPEHVKDLLWASIAVVAYLAGSTEAGRKEEK